MALTQVSSKGIKDATLLNEDVNASAAIAKSKIENFVNNNADNRVITGSGTGNTLEGEANLTFDSSTDTLQVHQQNAGNNPAFKSIHRGGSGSNINAHFTNYSGTNHTVILHDGSVGIGLQSPSSILHTKTSGGEGLRLQGTATSNFLRFTDASNNSTAYIGHDTQFKIANQNNTDTVLHTNNSERMRITSAGNVGIGSSSPANKLNVEDSASGVIVAKQTTNNGGFNTFEGKSSSGTTTFYASHNGRVGASEGIIFGSDTASSNVLDDYEEGVFTPTATFDGSDDGNKVYAYQGGSYTKIGRAVHCNLMMVFSNRGTGSGRLILNGLPFTVGDVISNTSLESSGSVGYFAGLISSVSDIKPIAVQGTSSLYLYGVLGQQAASVGDFGYSHVGNAFSIRLSITYFQAV